MLHFVFRQASYGPAARRSFSLCFFVFYLFLRVFFYFLTYLYVVFFYEIQDATFPPVQFLGEPSPPY